MSRKVHSFTDVERYQTALNMGDVIHLTVDGELMQVISRSMDVGDMARTIHKLVKSGCVDAVIVTPTELDAFLDSLTNEDLVEAALGLDLL